MHINSPIMINWGDTISKMIIPRERRGFILVTFTDVSYSQNLKFATSLWDELFMLPHTSSDVDRISPFIQTSFIHGIPTRTNRTFSNLMQDSADAPILPRVLPKVSYRSHCYIWLLQWPTECASHPQKLPSSKIFPTALQLRWFTLYHRILRFNSNWKNETLRIIWPFRPPPKKKKKNPDLLWS